MSWKNFRPIDAGKDFIFLLWSLFIATWPSIITNLISDLFARFLKINTSAGAWAVVAAAISSIIMYGILRRRTDPNGPHNAPQQSASNSKYYRMQGGMLSLGIALNQLCQGIFTGPPTDAKILPAVMALIPAIEGVLGAQFIQLKNSQALYYIDKALKELILNNPRINERMILEHAKGLGIRDNIELFASLNTRETNELVRSRMVHFASTPDLDNYLGKNQEIAIDSFHDPNKWRIEKKEIAQVETIATQAPESIHAAAEEQRKVKEIEETQRGAWQRLQANFADEDALHALLRQAYHTTHGLIDSVRVDIASEMNHVLLSSLFPEHRDLTPHERNIIHKLGSILGYG